ncbi:MAG: hypothetical protein ACI4AK_01565 [Lepagella sp.]
MDIMGYTKYSPEMKVLARTIVNKLDYSGCGTYEGIEILSDIIASMLAVIAPSKGELMLHLDDKLLPYIRKTAFEVYDSHHYKD